MKRTLFLLLLFMPGLFQPAVSQVDTTLFGRLNLAHSGLEVVAKAVADAHYDRAAEALLDYYRQRRGVVCPDLDLQNLTLSAEHRRWADEGLEHRFFVHTGYQPSYFYGEDIDWQYWPVRDNELRWQLHRTKWWVPMGKAYRLTGDEKYAREWCLQYLDWMKKNPLTHYVNTEKGPGEGTIDLMTADNVYFAWRPLEVSDRLEFQIHQFQLFLPSPSFDGEFLSHFLVNYDRHGRHLAANFSAQGNHRIFQAQRLLYGAIFFPELKEAAEWSKQAVEILNQEIQRQVYDDGMQFELDPHYHLEAINIFANALRMADANGRRDLFPESYLNRMEQMIEVHYNYSFPDYTNPMFSDAKLHEKEYTFPYYATWSELFPQHEMIRYLATEGQEGAQPDYLSRAFSHSGFYVLRNGWDSGATVMSLKAGPPAFWHCQPDNGTFELWHRGRQFFPDSGSYVYSGDEEINAMRRWFRQTRQHNTLTLDGRDLEQTASRCLRFECGPSTDILRVENPSYEGLTHRRTIHFVDRSFYVIVDEALGDAGGEVELNYHLLECDPQVNKRRHSLATRFADGNNLLLQVWGASRMQMRVDTGRVSRTYRHYAERPSCRFSVKKEASRAVRFVTLLCPFEGQTPPRCTVKLKGETLHVRAGKKRYLIDVNE